MHGFLVAPNGPPVVDLTNISVYPLTCYSVLMHLSF